MTLWEISPLQHADIDPILEIERLSFKSPWSRNSFLDELACSDAFSHVVKPETDFQQRPIIAYVCARLTIDEFHILKIAVAPDQRGRGIATRLLNHLFNLALAKGADTAFLEVRPSNTPAINLYKKAGFHFIGRRPKYYPETGEDALVMTKHL